MFWIREDSSHPRRILKEAHWLYDTDNNGAVSVCAGTELTRKVSWSQLFYENVL